jgi:acyl-coenzyme A synthetase/AMP-(fatty) acid ligase
MSESADIELISYGRRLSLLAAEQPERVAIVFARLAGGELEITRRELDETSNRMARLFAEHAGPDPGLVVVGLPNSPEHYFACYAAWKLGACVLPMRWDLPRWERDRMLEIADASIVVADWEDVEHAVVVPTPAFRRRRCPIARRIPRSRSARVARREDPRSSAPRRRAPRFRAWPRAAPSGAGPRGTPISSPARFTT